MDELPPLPAPHMRESTATARNTRSVRHGYEQGGYARWPNMYTADQMRAYAAAAVAQAIEACAKLCEAPGMVEDRDGLEEAARRIRATIPRTTAPQE